MCREIFWYIGRSDENIPTDYQQSVDLFHWLIRENPYVILIDSLDQLSNDYEARSSITFLANMTPHIDTRIIVSCLPDEKNMSTGKWIYCYGCDTRLLEANIPRVTVPAISSIADVEEILLQLLNQQSRQLSRSQLDYALTKALEEPTVLYLSLAVRVLRYWTSGMVEDECLSHGTVPELIHQIFESLENKYGSTLTRVALAMLTHAVDGLRESEMEDLLSINANVLDSVYEYHKSSWRTCELLVSEKCDSVIL